MYKFEPTIFDSVANIPANLFWDYYHDDDNEVWGILFDKAPDYCYDDVVMLWEYLVDNDAKVHLYFKEDDGDELYTGFIFESEQDLLAFKLKWL